MTHIWYSSAHTLGDSLCSVSSKHYLKFGILKQQFYRLWIQVLHLVDNDVVKGLSQKGIFVPKYLIQDMIDYIQEVKGSNIDLPFFIFEENVVNCLFFFLWENTISM